MNLTRMASRWRYFITCQSVTAMLSLGPWRAAHGTHEAAQVNACPLCGLCPVSSTRAAGCCVPLAVFGVTCGDSDHTHVHTFKVQFVGGSSRE